jgi:hypothetical protein
MSFVENWGTILNGSRVLGGTNLKDSVGEIGKSPTKYL